MNNFEFYLPDTSPKEFLLFMGGKLGFFRPGAWRKPIEKTGVIYREYAFNNSLTVDIALSYRDDWTAEKSRGEPKSLYIALFYTVKDRTGTHQNKSVVYCHFMALKTGSGLDVSGYLDNPKEITWDEDGALIPLPDGFPEKQISGLFEKIVSDWPEAIWSEGEPKKARVQPGPTPKKRDEKIRAFERGQKRKPGTTIEEYLREQFGEHADGSPKVARSTYYGWGKLKPVQKPVHDSD